MSYHDTDSDYTNLLEMRAEWEQQAENEHRRYIEAHPGYEQCPKHPDRPVVDSNVCTLRHCAECVQEHQQNWADTEPHPWANRDDYDMPHYSDHPRYRREDKR